MAYTGLQLITKAYYLSQVVSRELQTVSGVQVSDGLELLNALLDVKGSDLRLIPYYQRYDFPTVAGQEEYFIENLLAVDAMTFNLGDVRFPMQDMTRYEYFGTPRVDNVNSLPFSYRCERELGGLRIFMYFPPNAVYTVKLSGKFGLTQVTLMQDMSLTYDLYYLEYLRFALAEYICLDYGQTFPQPAKMKLEEMRKKLLDTSPKDLSLRKLNYFYDARGGLTWQQINIGGGYTP
ncbi:MAG: hypothetical protein ACRC1W_12220 [Shewanella sp.]